MKKPSSASPVALGLLEVSSVSRTIRDSPSNPSSAASCSSPPPPGAGTKPCPDLHDKIMLKEPSLLFSSEFPELQSTGRKTSIALLPVTLFFFFQYTKSQQMFEIRTPGIHRAYLVTLHLFHWEVNSD